MNSRLKFSRIERPGESMKILGEEILHASIAQGGFFLKVIFNERVAYFFPYTIEHKDASLPGLCYRDDSLGDALAATIKPSHIDIRLHKAYTPPRVKSIVEQMALAIGNRDTSMAFEIRYGGDFLTTVMIKLPSD